MPRSVLMIWTACLACALAWPLPGAEAPKPQVREANPIKALQGAAAGFKKVKGYHVGLDVNGGYSESANHALSETVVRESYSGEVYGGVMSLAKGTIYRTQKGGTVLISGQWKDIHSDPKSVKTVRLFRFPEQVLTNAIKHAPLSAKWVDPPKGQETEAEAASEDDQEEDDEDDDEDTDGDDEDEEGVKSAPQGKAGVKAEPKGSSKALPKTTVKGPAATAGKPGKPDPKGPWIIRVEAPAEEALAHILEVQNSNCFGGG